MVGPYTITKCHLVAETKSELWKVKGCAQSIVNYTIKSRPRNLRLYTLARYINRAEAVLYFRLLNCMSQFT